MAPEVIDSRKEGYSAKIDIWSLGCVVLEMFAGKRPWSTEEAIGAMFKVNKFCEFLTAQLGNERKAPPIPNDVMEYMSPDAKDFLEKCFTMYVALHLILKNLVRHPNDLLRLHCSSTRFAYTTQILTFAKLHLEGLAPFRHH
jgi:mitogen-activated protein kinase kinase kinase